MSETHDLLVEIGTEELPPKALRALSEAFGRELCAGLASKGLEFGEHAVYATPRRLAVLITDVPESQPDRDVERRGPAVSAAFDDDGEPTRAAEGFAGSCGVAVDQLERLENDDGAWLLFRSTEVGEATAALLPALVEDALSRLPIPRRMRWADLDVEFVRPVHWVVMLLGESVVKGDILGISAGRITHGHRFHHPEGIALEDPSSYAMTLYGQGHVVAEFDARRETIRGLVEESAETLGGKGVIDDDLLDEVAALVEWPVAVIGNFDASFLELPDAVLVATMKGNQRYFHVVGDDGALLPHFITISNIDSRNPDAVRAGNERVIRPRLADAAFFYRADLASSLADREAGLRDVVFQERLGTVHDKAQRVAQLVGHVAIAMGGARESVEHARRAAELSKCDLLTEMVGEFPELQGVMGGEYARRDGEPEEVCVAIAEAYMPRFAGDAIPATAAGRAVAIADRLDTLVGIFGIGQAPTGDRDPYALRRAALGVLRIVIEGELNLDLTRILPAAVTGFGDALDEGDVAADVLAFTLDRLRAYFVEQGIPVTVFNAVQARQPTRPLDFARRVHAVDGFRKLPESESLSAASKRIQNILRQAGDDIPAEVDDSLFVEDAEWNLAAMLVGLGPRVKDLLGAGDYTGAMTMLAGLRDNVDAFFDTVKVMADEEQVRRNRLALLNNISTLFLATADISRLQE